MASPMNNALDSWIATAEETKRVDRLSSVLGLDSPALSCGLSPASRGLNAQSPYAFRFLPFLQETFPDLLRHNSNHLEQFDLIAKPARRQNDHRYNNATRTNFPRGPYRPRFENPKTVADRGARLRAVNPTSSSFEVDRPPAVSVATSDVHTSGNASGTSAGAASTATIFSTTPQKFPAWPEPKPASVADLLDWDMDAPDHASSVSHLSHLQATNGDHGPTTCVESAGSLTPPISDHGFHYSGIEDELDEETAAPMVSYHEQKDDRIWRWLNNRPISPVCLDTASSENPDAFDAFSGEPWLPRGRNA